LADKRFYFDAKIDIKTFEVLNSEFKKGKCFVLYTEENRNGSYISKDSVEKAIKSIFNVPVIAEIKYKEGEKDFGTHGGRIIIDDDGIKFEQTTVPFGVVPESCNPRWETVDDKEYFVVDVILWAGRYEDLSILVEDGSRPQSMEINPIETSVDENKYVHIDTFEFSALTILGADVEPCFEEAKIEIYNLNEFEVQFKEMMKKIYALQKGGEEVPKDFKLTAMQKLDLLNNALTDERNEDNDGNLISCIEYWVMDFDDSFTYIRVWNWNSETGYTSGAVRAKYSIDEENESASIDKSTFEEIIEKWVTKEEAAAIDEQRSSEFNALQEQFNTLTDTHNTLTTSFNELTANFEALETECQGLREYKINIEKSQYDDDKTAIFEAFEEELGNIEEFKTLKETFSGNLDDLEKELYALSGKLKSPKDFQKKSKMFVNALPTEPKAEDDSKKVVVYGSAEKFFKKKQEN
jgi:hypothetical protein